MRNIVLIGYMGTGKSSVARSLNEKTGMPIVEMDEELVKRHQMSINEMFERFGETWFRDRESELCAELGSGEGRIISCGGGTVLRYENVLALKKGGRLYVLTAEPETIYERIKEDRSRPLLKDRMSVETIRQMLASRAAAYEKAADYPVRTDALTPDEIADVIIKEMSNA